MGAGTLLASVAAFAVADRQWGRWVRARGPDHLWAALCGVIWTAGTLAMAESIRRIGLAVTWPMVNLNTVVTVTCGALIFHEVSVRKHGRTIALGLLAGMVGVALLGVARL